MPLISLKTKNNILGWYDNEMGYSNRLVDWVKLV